VTSTVVGTNIFGALTLDGSQPDCAAGLRLKSGSTLFITETATITAQTCEDSKQSVIISQDYVIQPAFQVLVTMAVDALTSADWNSVLQGLFRQELASDLEFEPYEKDRIVILSAVEPAARRLLALEVTIEIHCATTEDANSVRVFAESKTFAPAASRAGINGAVRMLSISISGPPSDAAGDGGGASSDGSPVVLPINGTSNVTIVDAPVSSNTDMTVGVTIALGSFFAAAVAVALISYLARRRQQHKAAAKKAADIKAFRNLLDLSRGAQDELTSNLTEEQLSLQTVTCSLEYGDSFDEDDYFSSGSQSEIDTFNDYSSGSSSDSEGSSSTYLPPRGTSVDTWDGVSVASTRSTESLNSINENFVDVPPQKMPRGIKRRVYGKNSASGTPRSSTRSSAGPSPRNTPRGANARGIRRISEDGTAAPGPNLQSIPFMERVEHTLAGGVGVVEASIVSAPPRPARAWGRRDAVETQERLGREDPRMASPKARSPKSKRSIRGPARNRPRVHVPEDAASTSSESSAISLALDSGDGTGTNSPAATGSGTQSPVRGAPAAVPRREVRHTDSGVSSAGTGSSGVHLTIGSGTTTPVHTDSGQIPQRPARGLKHTGSGINSSEGTSSTGDIFQIGDGLQSGGGSGTHTPSHRSEHLHEVPLLEAYSSPVVPHRNQTNIFSTMAQGSNVQYVTGKDGKNEVRLTSRTSFHDTTYQEDDTDDCNDSEVEAVVLDLHLEESRTPGASPKGSQGFSPRDVQGFSSGARLFTPSPGDRLAHRSRLKGQMEGGLQQFDVPLTPTMQTPVFLGASPAAALRSTATASDLVHPNFASPVTRSAAGLQQFSPATSSNMTPRNLSGRREFKVPVGEPEAAPVSDGRKRISVPLQGSPRDSVFETPREHREVEEVNIEAAMMDDEPKPWGLG